MPSKLSGLIRALAWSDYPTLQGTAPVPGTPSVAAMTDAPIALTGGRVFKPDPGSSPARFRIEDNVVASVAFAKATSFVMSWVLARPQAFQDDLLHHEQGHYDISALCVRDLFVDAMLLKSKTFDSEQKGIAEFLSLKGQTFAKAQKISSLYDREVHPEQSQGNMRGPFQLRWDSFIKTAFTKERSTGTTSPDGIPHKERLVDVLLGDGKKI
jgi:hypothetical protein